MPLDPPRQDATDRFVVAGGGPYSWMGSAARVEHRDARVGTNHLGASLTQHLFELRWITRRRDGRAVRVTATGQRELRQLDERDALGR